MSSISGIQNPRPNMWMHMSHLQVHGTYKHINMALYLTRTAWYVLVHTTKEVYVQRTHCSTNFEYKFFGVQSPGVVLSSRLHDLFRCWIIKGVQDCFSSVLCQFCVFLSQHSVYFLTVVRKNVFLQWKLSVSFMLDEYSEGHGSVSCVNLCDHCVFSLCLFLLVVLRFWTL